jgi:antitoxin HicB
MVYFCRLNGREGAFEAEFPDVPGLTARGATKDETLFKAAQVLNRSLEIEVGKGNEMPVSSLDMQAELYPVQVEAHIMVAWTLRQLRGDTPQSEIATKLGLTYQAYQRLENPRKANPSIKTLERVALVFGKRLEIHIS